MAIDILRWARLLALAIVPLTLTIVALCVTATIGHFVADPDHMYLMNGLNIVQLVRPYLDNHPGVPAQVLCAMVIGVMWLVRCVLEIRLPIQDDVILHGEHYLFAIHATMAMLAGGCVYFFGRRVLAATGSILAACAAQTAFLLSATVLTVALIHVSAEIILVSLTALLAGVQAPLVLSRIPEPQERRLALPVGMLLGACIATKATAAPLLLTLGFFHSRGVAIKAALASAVGLIVFTFPIASDYLAIASWLFSILIHAGSYGSGEIGLPASDLLWQRASAALDWAPDLFLCAAACLILFVARAGQRYADRADFGRLFLVSALPIAVLLALVIKQPPPYYVISVVATAGLALAGMTYLIVLMKSWLRWCGAMMAGVLIILGLSHSKSFAVATYVTAWLDSATNLAFLDKFTEDGCAFVYYYDPREVPEWKIFVGFGWAGKREGRRLARLHPKFMAYDRATEQIVSYAGAIDPRSDFAREKCVYFVGYVMDASQVPSYLTPRARASEHPYSLAVYEYRLPPVP
jgi:hypothetical protein